MMRAGRRIVLALAVLGGGAFLGSTTFARGAEPLDDRLGIRDSAGLSACFDPTFRRTLGSSRRRSPKSTVSPHEFYAKALSLKGKVGPEVVAARRAIDEEESEWMSSHLKSEQRERLGQIDLQWEGASALLNRPVVAEYLGLTSEQQDQVARVISDAKRERVRQRPVDLRRAPRNHQEGDRTPFREAETTLGESPRASVPIRHRAGAAGRLARQAVTRARLVHERAR